MELDWECCSQEAKMAVVALMSANIVFDRLILEGLYFNNDKG